MCEQYELCVSVRGSCDSTQTVCDSHQTLLTTLQLVLFHTPNCYQSRNVMEACQLVLCASYSNSHSLPMLQAIKAFQSLDIILMYCLDLLV